VGGVSVRVTVTCSPGRAPMTPSTPIDRSSFNAHAHGPGPTPPGRHTNAGRPVRPQHAAFKAVEKAAADKG
jgi:hypothetical protein